jgi:hypothetical protein
MKYIRAIIIGLVLGAAVITGVHLTKDSSKTMTISTFEQCAAAGYPVQESFPERCTTPDGQSFTK